MADEKGTRGRVRRREAPSDEARAIAAAREELARARAAEAVAKNREVERARRKKGLGPRDEGYVHSRTHQPNAFPRTVAAPIALLLRANLNSSAGVRNFLASFRRFGPEPSLAQLRAMRSIVEDLNAALLHGNDISWKLILDAKERLDGENPRRAAVLGILEEGVRRRISLFRNGAPPDRLRNALLRHVRAQLTRVDRRFFTLPPPLLDAGLAKVEKLEPDAVTSARGAVVEGRKGGAGKLGVVGLAASLSCACEAFGDCPKDSKGAQLAYRHAHNPRRYGVGEK